MQEVFLVNDQGNYNSQNQTDVAIPWLKSVKYDLESIRVSRPKIRESLSNDLKNKESLIVLKQPLRNGNLNHVLAVFVKLIY